MPAARIEENLLFGVLAFQRRMIAEEQFVQAAVLWSLRFESSIAEILIQQRHLTDFDRRDIDRDVARILQKHRGDARESLRWVANPETQALLSRLDQSDVRRSISGLNPATHPEKAAAVRTIPPDSIESLASSRYSLIREYAEGGLGKIFLARDASLHRQVALKELKSEKWSDDEHRRRFLKEAQITGQLEHPNIVPVYELARRPEDDQPYYTMRFIEGRTLGDAIADHHAHRQSDGRDDPLEFRRLLDAFVSVCNAVAYAHSRGVIHRDLKPANIMLGEFGVVVVLDWGLAKVIGQPEEGIRGPASYPSIHVSEDSQTQTAGLSGTPAYMAPEQAEARHDLISERTDVYGLGAILFEMLTGRLPIEEESAVETVRQILARDTPRARGVKSDVPKTLDAICARAMAKKPEDRYASASDLGDEVRKWLADEPVQAASDPWSVRVRRWVKRHPALAASIASATLMAMVALAGYVAIQKRHNQTLTKANEDLGKANQLAEAELDLAMEAIRSFHGEVAEDTLLNQADPALEKLRFRMLEVPQGFYERLIDRLKAAEADSPGNQQRLGYALFHLAHVNAMKGSAETAVKAYGEAIKIQERLARNHPQLVRNLSDLVRTHNNLAVLYRNMNRVEDAETAYGRAITIGELLIARNPGDEASQSDLAATQHNFGVLCGDTNRFKEAETFYRQALRIRERLAESNPDIVQRQSDLAATLHNLGALCLETSRTREAETFDLEALRIRERLAADHPSVPRHQAELAATRNNLGSLYSETNRTQDAEASYQEALEIRKKLANDHPTVAQYSADLAEGHRNLGTLYLKIHRTKDAELAFEEASKLLRSLAAANPAIARFWRDLAACRHDLGAMYSQTHRLQDAEAACQEALQIRRRLAADNPRVARHQNDLAQSLDQLGTFYVETHRPDKAEPIYKEALRISQRLADADPAVAVYQSDLAQVHNNLGRLYETTYRLDEAEASYNESLRIRRGLAEADPAFAQRQSDLAQTYNNLGAFYRRANRIPEAESAHKEALRIRQRLIETDPAVAQHQIDLAVTYHNLGSLYSKSRRFAEGETSYREALRIRERLATADPAIVEHKDALALIHYYLGTLYNSTNRVPEAEASYKKSLGIRKRLAESHPDLTQNLSELARTHQTLGNLHYGANQVQATEKSFGEALKVFQKLAAEHPNVALHQVDLASIQGTLGLMHGNRGDHSKAIDLLGQAISRLTSVLQQHPKEASAQLLLGNAYQVRARIHESAARYGDAADDWGQAIQRADAAKAYPFRASWAYASARAGRHREAVKEVEELSGVRGFGPVDHYNFACAVALSITAARNDETLPADERRRIGDRYAAVAMAILRRLEKSGYFRDPDNARQFREDSDLDALRATPEFVGFAGDLMFPEDPFQR